METLCYAHGGTQGVDGECYECVRAAARDAAVLEVLAVIRAPLRLMSVPEREEALERARTFNITAADLIQAAAQKARNA